MDYTRNTNPARWMSDLPDASYLHDLLIPGAHNAIAGPQSATDWSQCQDRYIMGLLNRGYRYFDFRLAECRPEHYNSFAGSNSLCFWHGKADIWGDYLDLNLDQVAWELYHFLQNNPREVITVKIALEYGHPATSPNGFLQRVERYFQGHHEWWVHPGVCADNANKNIPLRDVRGRIVVFWDCDGCEISGWGLNNRSQVDRHSSGKGDGSFDSFDQAWNLFRTRAAASTYKTGFYELESAWTRWVDYLFAKAPIKPRTAAGEMNPKVTDILFGRLGNTMSQKGLVAMDFGIDVMVNQIIDITRVRQFRWLTHWWWG